MDIIAAIVGGFLAAGTGWLLQNRQEASRICKLKKLWITAITEDLESSVDLYEQISNGWLQSKIIWFNLLNELDDSRSAFYRNRDYVVLLDDIDLRGKILKYYRKSSTLINQLRNTQQREYDLHNKLKVSEQELLFKNPGMSLDQAIGIVITANLHDDEELGHIKKTLPELVNSLEGLRADARDILEKLK